MNRKTYNLQRPVLSLLLFCSSFSPLLLVSKYVLLHSPLYTVACNHVSTCVTKNMFCSGQSKTKVLKIKLQSLPANLRTFWRLSAFPREKTAPLRILSNLVLFSRWKFLMLLFPFFFLLKLLLFIWMPTQLTTEKH